MISAPQMTQSRRGRSDCRSSGSVIAPLLILDFDAPNFTVDADAADDAVDLRTGQLAVAFENSGETGNSGVIVADDLQRGAPHPFHDFMRILWIDRFRA